MRHGCGGGHDNSGADQEQAARIEKILPMARSLATSNRMFVSRAVGWAAAAKEQDGHLVPGVRQFIDIGCEFPPNGRTHEIARHVRRSPSVVYVDDDPEVIDNLQALPAADDGTRVAAVRGDLRDPDAVFAAVAGAGPGGPGQPRIIDLDEPTCLLLTAVLHAMPPGGARELAAGYARLLAPGSYTASAWCRPETATGRRSRAR
jgi:hypothetical protein